MNDWILQDLIELVRSGLTPFHPEKLAKMIHISALPKRVLLYSVDEAEKWVADNWGWYKQRRKEGPDFELYQILYDIFLDERNKSFEDFMSFDAEGNEIYMREELLEQFVGVKSSYVKDGYITYKDDDELNGFVFIKKEIKEQYPEVLVDTVEIESDPEEEEGLREYKSFCLRIDELQDVESKKKRALKSLVYALYRKQKTRAELAKELSLSASQNKDTLERHARRYLEKGRCLLKELPNDLLASIGLDGYLVNDADE